MEDYPAHLFLDLIINEGAILRSEKVMNGYSISVFIGPTGKGPVQIITSDEFIPIRVMELYLKKLGMSDLIPRFLD